MVQNGDEEGEVNLLNSDYTTNRFAFTYSWWSAYGYDRHIESNQARLASAAVWDPPPAQIREPAIFMLTDYSINSTFHCVTFTYCRLVFLCAERGRAPCVIGLLQLVRYPQPQQ